MLASTASKWHKYPSDVIGMWIADPDFPHAPFIKKALHDAVEIGDLYYDTDTPTRDVVVAKLKRRNNLTVTSDDLFFTPGVIAGMWIGAQMTDAKPGDEVILNDPMYQHFAQQAQFNKMKPVFWVIDEKEGYKFDIEALKELVTPKTKLIYVCNPHNPTGRVMTMEELRGVADIAVDHKIHVMADELWEDIIYDGHKHVSLASLNPEIEDLTLTTWGISKTWGIPGLHFGYSVMTNKDTMERIQKRTSEIYHGAPTLSKAAARVVLQESSEYWIRGIMKQLHKTRDIATKRLRGMGCTVPELEGTYLMLTGFNVELTHDELYKLLLEKAKVALQSGTEFGPHGIMHMRMTTATSERILNEALDRIETTLKSL